MAQDNAFDPFADEVVSTPSKEPTEASTPGFDPFSGESPEFGYKTEQAAQEVEESPEESMNFADYFNKAGEVYSDVQEKVRGGVETLASMATGIASSTVGGLAGLGAVMQGYSPDQAAEIIQKTQEDYTYVPKTESGKEVLNTISKPFQYYGEFTDYMADRQYEAWDESPVAGTVYKTAWDAIPMAIGAKPLTKPIEATTTGIRTVAKSSKKILGPKAREAAIKEGAINQIKKDIEDLAPLQREAAKTAKIKEDIPGYDPTFAEATGSKALVSRQRELDVETPQTISKVYARRKKNVEAVQNFLKESFGKEQSKVYKAFFEAKGGINKALNKLEERISDADTRRAKLVSDETVSQVIVGKKLRQILDEEYQLAKAKGAALYGKVGSANVNLQRVYNKVEDVINKDLANASQSEIPSVIRELSTRRQEINSRIAADPITGKKSVPVQSYITDFDQARYFDRELGSAIAAEKAAMRPDNNKIRLLVETKQELQKAMDALELSDDAAVAQAYKEAKNYWRESVADKYYSGLGKRIRQEEYGEWGIADEKLIDEIFSPPKMRTGGVKAAREFKAIYGENPEAMAQLNLGVMQKFRDFPGLVKDGIINPKRVAAFKEKYREVLAEFPSISKQIDNVDDANTALADLQHILKRKKARIEETALAKALNTNDYSTIVETAVKSPEIMRRLTMAIKSPEAKAGLSKAISEYTLRKATRKNPDLDGMEYIDADAMYGLLRDNGRAISMGMKPEHFKALTEAYDALRILDRVKLPGEAKARVGIGQRFFEAVGSSPRSVLNMMRARQQGRTSTVDISAVLAGGLVNKVFMRRIMALERAAHYDMDAAKVLRDLAKAEKWTPPLQRRMNSVFYKLGLGAEIAATEPEENSRVRREKEVRKKSSDFTYEMMQGVK